ncbi:hypothetical protein DSECCO2_455540 [anaerobic digester metagenome]|jgi:hypothetical protein
MMILCIESGIPEFDELRVSEIREGGILENTTTLLILQRIPEYFQVKPEPCTAHRLYTRAPVPIH